MSGTFNATGADYEAYMKKMVSAGLTGKTSSPNSHRITGNRIGVADKGAIERSMEDIQHSLAHCEEVFARLVTKIGPALSGQDSSTDKEPPVSPTSGSSSVAQVLGQYVERINNLRRRIDQIADQVEL